ncbi:type 1 glutamine amidotransferase domain-containing protein [Demequina sp. NBRC 110056]|uniref:type 1 glutamine amidotransferase domain-containing protein n=1 Tax=Demequina sp. NBRC 110056 TaxID=1570345 RepID=UPI000A078FCE|nr:type 1 glutamine amidotransferase domain-containing protein [Demequina sp. NBRC 110056]
MSALIITTTYGVEQDELKRPLEGLREAGVPVTLAAPGGETIQTLVGDKDPGETFTPDVALEDIEAADHAVLVIPGGTINADTLRTHEAAVSLVRRFAADGRTVAAICHGPWLLAEADVAGGKTTTSYPSLATDLRNAGATWVDGELQRCEANGFTLLTSRNPDDLDAFVPAVVEAAR